MTEFYRKFKVLCEQKGVSAAHAAYDMGLSNSTTTKWSMGSVPLGKTLQAVAKYFNVSVDYLMGEGPYSEKTVTGWSLYEARCEAKNIQRTMELLIDGLDREVCALLTRSKTEGNVMARYVAELFSESYMPVLQLLNDNLHNLAKHLAETEENQYAKAQEDRSAETA